MSKYNVFVYNAATYEGVEANSEEEAKRIALESGYRMFRQWL